MLVEVKLSEAVRRMEEGESVRAIKLSEKDWRSTKPFFLDEYLKNVVCFVDDSKKASAKSQPVKKERGYEISQPTKKEKETEMPKMKQEVDIGKIYSLTMANWTPEEIAEDMRLPIEIVRDKVVMVISGEWRPPKDME